MDFFSNILPHDGLAYVGVFWLAMGLGLVVGGLLGKGLRRVALFTHFAVRGLLTLAGIGVTVALAVPAVIAFNTVAVLPAAALLAFTIALVVCLGDPANIWDGEQKKWVVSLGETQKA
ncbi:MAG TPA: hypothetical protein V6D22_10965 [Candidatus Obscuribacterales bacterium]